MENLNVRPPDFAAKLDVSLSSAEGYYSGNHRVRKVVCLAVEAAWGISADYIMHGKKPEYSRQRALEASSPAMKIAEMADSLPVALRRQYKLALRGWHRIREHH